MIYLLVNPHSGDKSGLTKARRLQETYADLEINIYVTQQKDDEWKQLERILQNYQASKDRLLVIGGDGTLSKVLSYWPKEEPLAYLPAGSANDFIKGFGGLPAEKVLEAMNTNRTRTIHVFKSKNYLILNSLGIGFDARVINYSEHSALKSFFNRLHLGKFIYLVFGIRSVFSKKSASISLTDAEGRQVKFKNPFLFVLANTAYFGGGVMIWPQASVETEHLDLVYLQKRNLYYHISGLLALLFRQHDSSKKLQHKVYTAVKLKCSEPTLAQIDGESVLLQEETFICQVRKIYA
ncbi:diacylglycerol/lipid kinase family protein [Streptococcus panodentis]|uniref:Diacylglycerol kinase n=1 Tax=Streptococcus panodentis TaxID=1581472 RepID=A0ABS5AUI7_9STRE|nr:diacylglycerol kinase family protein [Streptococcus panodentis]MBP2620229.1 diacylglycerol kinase [Streptococcus panodentis]